MHRNQPLYEFLVEHSRAISDEWYEHIVDHDPTSVYASKNPVVIATLKEQNYDFILHLNKIFIEEENEFFITFEDWIIMISKDGEHSKTPIPSVIREFIRVRNVYLDYVKAFAHLHQDRVKPEDILLWNKMVMKALDVSIHKFVDEAYTNANRKLAAQQEMINELSSPVIALNDDKALLPLIGDIDTARARRILENTLMQCSKQGIKHLFIDLSGVVFIDTIVAQQIFQLLKALKLIGVSSTISGIRPEIAQTSVQLGFSFEGVGISSTLAKALEIDAK
ncbi:MAG: STAS domain-containing protein [Bacillota bacterium]|nr:STAS domain-containing protein [Bacillota bacterium]MDP4171538.1 STAS domain-containing protein [Bacillota bacterium]